MPAKPATLQVGDVTVTVFAEFGARLGQLTVEGQPLLVDVPPLDGPHPLMWGCYPMAPWAGRIRRGRFTFEGTEHLLPINHRDADGPERSHAIHGLVYDRNWPDVDEVSDTSWTATRSLEWGFGGSVTQAIELFDDHVELTLTVESSGNSFPAEVGWHPWFRKPDRLEFSPTSMYERDEFGLPTGALVDPADGPWDDCFLAVGPVELHYQRRIAPVVRVASGCDHWVVYDEPANATCVEPQSGPPDAFNLEPHVVTPTTPLSHTMTISW